MPIVRISKKEDTRKYFEDLINSGLISYEKSEYNKWYWQYMENPFCLSHDLGVWTYVQDDKSVSHVGGIASHLQVGQRKINIGWCVSFKTLPGFKAKGLVAPGKALVREASKQFDAYMNIGLNDMGFKVLTSLQWRFLGYIPYYIKIWNSKNIVSEKIKNSLISNIVSTGFNIFLKVYNCIKRTKRPKAITVSRIGCFSEEADLFWKEISGSYKIAVPRDKAFLVWKYDKQPDMDYVKFRACLGNKPRGYIVARTVKDEAGNKEGLITDIIAYPDDSDAVNALLFEALEYLKSEKCSLVRCLMNNTILQKILRNCGFINRRSTVRFMLNKNIEGLDVMYDLNNWHITAGDCDLDR